MRRGERCQSLQYCDHLNTVVQCPGIIAIDEGSPQTWHDPGEPPAFYCPECGGEWPIPADYWEESVPVSDSKNERWLEMPRLRLIELIVVLVFTVAPVFFLASKVDFDEWFKSGAGLALAGAVLAVYKVWQMRSKNAPDSE